MLSVIQTNSIQARGVEGASPTLVPREADQQRAANGAAARACSPVLISPRSRHTGCQLANPNTTSVSADGTVTPPLCYGLAMAKQQQGEAFDPDPRHVVIWTSTTHYWICREATDGDFAGDLIARDDQLLVIIGEGRVFEPQR